MQPHRATAANAREVGAHHLQCHRDPGHPAPQHQPRRLSELPVRGWGAPGDGVELFREVPGRLVLSGAERSISLPQRSRRFRRPMRPPVGGRRSRHLRRSWPTGSNLPILRVAVPYNPESDSPIERVTWRFSDDHTARTRSPPRVKPSRFLRPSRTRGGSTSSSQERRCLRTSGPALAPRASGPGL